VRSRKDQKNQRLHATGAGAAAPLTIVGTKLCLILSGILLLWPVRAKFHEKTTAKTCVTQFHLEFQVQFLCASGNAVRHAARVLEVCMRSGAYHGSQRCLVERHLSTSRTQSEMRGVAGAVKTGVAPACVAWATLERKWGTLLVGKKRSSERYQ